MILWMSELDKKEKRTLSACFGGWTLDAFDVNLYGLVIPTLLVALHFSTAQAGVLATVTLLMSAFGGWMAGVLADRFGRVRILQLTIIWFSFFTFLTGFAQDFTQFFIIRALQGLGFGGEWAAGAVLMGEVIRSRYRGRAVAAVQSGWPVGWGLAILAYAAVFSLLPQEVAWRVLFWIGLAPALLVLYVRYFVDEPEIFDSADKKSRGLVGQALSVFAPGNARTAILASLFSTGAMGSYYAVNIWLPTFLRTERKLSVLSTSGYLTVVIVGGILGVLAGGWFADRIGRKPTFFIFAVGGGLVVFLYMLAPITDGWMLVAGFPLGFFANGVFAPIGSFLTELFPTHTRATSQGFCYNFGRAIGALFPALIGFLSVALGGLGQAIGLFTLGAYGVLLAALLFLPETRGRNLEETDKENVSARPMAIA
ncbi:MAG TPA: MFS transporter [Pseudolabrys sp.]|nr:MFS transporter [Pseudolabrys sp.]